MAIICTFTIFIKLRALAPLNNFLQKKKIGFIRVALFYVQKNDFTFAIPSKMTCKNE